MAIKIGTIDVTGVAVGATGIGTVTIGSNVVWQRVLPHPLCFTGTATDSVRMNKVGNPDSANIEYSKDGNTWTAYTFGTWIDFDGTGNKVYFRAASDNNTSFYTDASNYYRFELDENYQATVSGNLDTLLNKNGTRHATKQNTFREMFVEMRGLKDASQLELPDDPLPNLCYYGMFQNCTTLSAAPELPATRMSASCYRSMFEGCTSLKSAPSVLPATTTQQYCYSRMFYGCTALTDAPAISATTLTTNCFQAMFSTDSNLSSVSVAFTDWRDDVTPTSYWLYQVAYTGKFYCPSELSVVRGTSNIPQYWAVNPPVESPNTVVKYTTESGLPDWESDIVGELTDESIPNIEDAEVVTIGDNVTRIGEFAFVGGYSLTSLTISDSVTDVGANAFEETGLTSVTFSGKTQATVQGMNEYSWELPSGCTIHCTDGDITI